MKILRSILFIVLCFLIVVLAIGFILPRKIHVERRLLISASQKTIFSQVNTLKNWIKWSYWLQMDTTAKLIFLEPESGVGATLQWKSRDKNIGNGSIIIMSCSSPDSLEVVFDFTEKGRSTGKFTFQKENENTNVIFSLESDLGFNPISRWFGLFSDQLIGPDIEMSLFNLDQLVQDKIKIYGFEINDYQMPARILISVRDTASPETITIKLALMYKKLSHFIKSNNISPIGNPIAIFHNYSTGNFDIEAGMPVSKVVPVTKGIICSEKPAQRTIKISYSGPYKQISSAYEALQTYLVNNDLQVNGSCWEEYFTNPTIEADPNNRQTIIYFPIQ